MFLLLLTTCYLLPASFVYAHGDKYLEFDPDNSAPLKVSGVETPSQVFFAQNDFLGGFDIWVANPGSGGTATFALLNEQGQVISSRIVSISSIAETTNGTKLHVDFSSQLAVLSGGKYSIRVTSSMPELRLYYSNRVKLISHNAPFVSEYVTGVGKLGSEEQAFSFKYALYETAESSAPIISNITWMVISTDEMRVDFNANESIDYRIEYGVDGQGYTQSTNFLGDYQFCVSGISSCSINIPVLPNTTYQYRLTVKDSWGNQSEATGTFVSGEAQTPTPSPTDGSTPTPSVTPSPTLAPDLTSPVISNLRIAELTNNSVGVAWTTNESASSHLLISSPQYITIAAASDPVFELEHFLQIENSLSPGAPYIATVTAFDNNNNQSKATISFSTLSSGPTPTPTPSSSVTPPPQQPGATSSPQSSPGITTSGAGSVQWSAPSSGEPADGYRVDVFDKDGNFIRTINVPAGSHSAEVADLDKGEYSVIVYSNNDGVYKKVDKPTPLRVSTDDTFLKRLVALWPYLLVVAGLIVIFILWEMKKMHKASQIPPQAVS